MKKIVAFLKWFFFDVKMPKKYVCSFCGFVTTVSLPKSGKSINFNCTSCIDKFFRNQTFVGRMKEDKGGEDDRQRKVN